jgi:hypothetical protein
MISLQLDLSSFVGTLVDWASSLVPTRGLSPGRNQKSLTAEWTLILNQEEFSEG